MSIRGRMWFLIVAGAGGMLAWWIAREPARPQYLANVVRQAHHLPGRYAV
jgi:hypothetical protein